jgi:hypothetical protein
MKKVAIGCGIAALLVLALVIAVFVFGARWMKGQLADMQRYSETSELMVSTYGAPEEFLPPADGVYDPQRVALYARMRGEITDAGAGFVSDAEELADYGDAGWFDDLKTMMQIANDGMDFLATADSLLMAADMGRGEYIHYQTLMLEGFFGDSPESFLDGNPGEVRNTDFYEAFEGFATEYRTEAGRLLKSHARLARAAAEDEGESCAPCIDWAAYIDDQLESARARRRHIPLSEPLPESLLAGFEQYRSQLSATRPTDYGTWLLSILMVMELDDDEGNFQIKINE